MLMQYIVHVHVFCVHITFQTTLKQLKTMVPDVMSDFDERLKVSHVNCTFNKV